MHAVCYKHIAPLGLNTDAPSSVQSAQSAIQTNSHMSPLWGFTGVPSVQSAQSVIQTNMSPLWGYRLMYRLM